MHPGRRRARPRPAGGAARAEDAVRLFRRRGHEAPTTVLEHIHAGLRRLRGAAVARSPSFEPQRGRVLFCGIGNVSGLCCQRRPAASDGVDARRHRALGPPSPRLRVSLLSPIVMVLHIRRAEHGNWTLRSLSRIVAGHPTLIAGVLYRDFARRSRRRHQSWWQRPIGAGRA